MRNLRYAILFLILSSLSLGCGPRVFHTVAPDYVERMPSSIAVLPVKNETVDLDAPEVFRLKLFNKILSKGYRSPPVEEIDSKLERQDIKEAGQLDSMLPEEIGEYMNVDAVLYTTVTEWSTLYLVLYASIKVGARFEVIDTNTGEQLWESEHTVTQRKLAFDDDSVKETLTFALLKQYEPFVEKVVDIAFSTLPNGPRYNPVRKRQRHPFRREEPGRVPLRR